MPDDRQPWWSLCASCSQPAAPRRKGVEVITRSLACGVWPLRNPPIKSSLCQFENHVNQRGAVIRLTVATRRMKLNVLRGSQGGIVQTMSQPFHHTVDVQRARSGEHHLE